MRRMRGREEIGVEVARVGFPEDLKFPWRPGN